MTNYAQLRDIAMKYVSASNPFYSLMVDRLVRRADEDRRDILNERHAVDRWADDGGRV